MSILDRNSAAMRSGQARWDNAEPEYDVLVFCTDDECGFETSGRDARARRLEHNCPECCGKLEVEE